MEEEKVILTDEEKMKKSFRSYGKIAQFIEVILLVVPIIIAIMFVAWRIIIFIGNNQKEGENAHMEVEVIESIGVKVIPIPPTDLSDLLELMDEEKFEEFEEFTEMPIFMQVLKVVCIIADYIITILIIDNLKKMFNEIAQNAKPFTENIVKRLNTISWLTFGLWIVTNANVGIVVVISIFALNKIFKYGYKLQIESDETL